MPKWTKNQAHTWGNSDDALTELWIYSIARKSLKHTDKQVKIYTGLLPAGLPYLTLNIFEEQEKRERIFNPLISGVKHEMQQNFALMVGRAEHKHPPKTCPLISSRLISQVKRPPSWVHLKPWKEDAQIEPICPTFDPCFCALWSPWPPFVTRSTKADERNPEHELETQAPWTVAGR